MIQSRMMPGRMPSPRDGVTAHHPISRNTLPMVTEATRPAVFQHQRIVSARRMGLPRGSNRVM